MRQALESRDDDRGRLRFGAARAALVIVGMLLAAACRSVPERGASAARVDGAGETSPLASAGCRSGTLPALVGEARAVAVDGETRRYLVDAAATDAAHPLPVVLAFHGFRHSAAGLRSGIGLAERAARGELVAVHAEGRENVRLLPDAVGRGWDTAPGDTRDTAFVAALLDALERERCVDRRRIYATGFSNGGFLANLLGCTLGTRLAAVAPVAGARSLDGCASPEPLPILFLYGEADRVVPPGLTYAAAAWWRRVDRCADAEPRAAGAGCRSGVDCAADLVVCAGPQAHVWPADATARILDFFRAHARRD